MAVATTVTVPGLVALNNPEPLIVAVPVPLITDQVTVGSVAFEGVTVAVICKVAPSTTVTAPPAPVTTIEATKQVHNCFEARNDKFSMGKLSMSSLNVKVDSQYVSSSFVCGTTIEA